MTRCRPIIIGSSSHSSVKDINGFGSASTLAFSGTRHDWSVVDVPTTRLLGLTSAVSIKPSQTGARRTCRTCATTGLDGQSPEQPPRRESPKLGLDLLRPGIMFHGVASNGWTYCSLESSDETDFTPPYLDDCVVYPDLFSITKEQKPDFATAFFTYGPTWMRSCPTRRSPSTRAD
ncbi:Aste57867_13058 [Aphanomyces stellatus]|uniref:Aste57867_13058 protein n=1 Tax=Aphanomyces stellatus TaxID=120398 RepID=A0A485KXH4_9STRA|nr:hypothetical protein As57867_013010 [Aphanomyces stellatus]VFT89903.1 Aste57867_13058 [Aphanomyces stellatus]